MRPLTTPNGELDYIPFVAASTTETLVQTSLAIKLPFLLSPLSLPAAEYLITHIGQQEEGTNKVISIEKVVTLYSCEKSDKEWAINWIIPIERMRQLVLETFQLTISCKLVTKDRTKDCDGSSYNDNLEGAPLWKLGVDMEVQVPNISRVLSRVIRLFMRESAIDMICFFKSLD